MPGLRTWEGGWLEGQGAQCLEGQRRRGLPRQELPHLGHTGGWANPVLINLGCSLGPVWVPLVPLSALMGRNGHS